MDYSNEFPKLENQYFKNSSFQDQQVPLTFIGWKKIANEDIKPKNGKPGISWKQRLKYQLRYSYPEFALDEAGEQRLTEDGKPMRNKNYDPKFKQGYTIEYGFEEGKLQSGSLPLWNAFCMLRPKKGERVLIARYGKDKETVWKVQRATDAGSVPSIDFSEPEYSGDPEVNPHHDEEVPF